MKTGKSSFLLALAVAALPLAAATPGTRTGSFAPGERVAPPETHAPASESRTMVKAVAPLAGRVAVEIPATGAGSLLVAAIPAGGAEAATGPSFALESPGGKQLLAPQAQSGDLRRFEVAAQELGLDLPAGVASVLHAGQAEAGTYRLSAPVGDGVSLVTVVAAEPDSPLVLRSWAAPLSRHAGQPVVLHAELSDSGAPVTGARVVARLAATAAGAVAGGEIALFDDGRHGDGAAGDGVYAASVAADDLPAGFVNARFDAEGRDARGAAFARTGSGGLMNEPALARLSSVDARFAGREGARRLHVIADVDVLQPGDYRLDAIVSGAADGATAEGWRPGLGWGERTVTLAKGSARVVLDIPASDLGGERPVHVDVRLLGLTTTGLAGRVELEAK